MKPVHAKLIRHECLLYAFRNDMTIIECSDQHFKAEGPNSIVDVPIEHLWNQAQQGWKVQDTLENETNYKE